MLEFAKQFIGQECIIYYFNSTFSGTIKEISESGNALLVEHGNQEDIINLEYVTRITRINTKKKRKVNILD